MEAKTVNIKTAMVVIKAIQIDDKQMTLSVFDQLPEKYLTDTQDVRGVFRSRRENIDKWIDEHQLWGYVKRKHTKWIVSSFEGKLFKLNWPSHEVYSSRKALAAIEDIDQLFIAV